MTYEPLRAWLKEIAAMIDRTQDADKYSYMLIGVKKVVVDGEVDGYHVESIGNCGSTLLSLKVLELTMASVQEGPDERFFSSH